MTCREFVDFLMDYLDGELPGEERRSFELHLRGCDECETYLETYRETVRLGRELLCPPDDGIPEEVPTDLVRAILAARRGDQEPFEK